MQDHARGFPPNVADHITQFQLGIFQCLLHPLDLSGLLLGQADPSARQVTQLALWTGRDETGFEQTVLQQVGNPLGIFDIGLAPGDRFDLLRIDHEHFKVACQQIKHRFPIHSRGLEGDMRTALLFEPIRELQ